LGIYREDNRAWSCREKERKKERKEKEREKEPFGIALQE